MGMDKEAADIWVFGRKRPDLSPNETLQARRTAIENGQTEPVDKAAYDAHIAEQEDKLIKEFSERKEGALFCGLSLNGSR